MPEEAIPDPVRVARSRVAQSVLRKWGPERERECRQDLVAAHLERAIRITLAADPPIANADLERLVALLAGGASHA